MRAHSCLPIRHDIYEEGSDVCNEERKIDLLTSFESELMFENLLQERVMLACICAVELICRRLSTLWRLPYHSLL
jgi:hypothetical protein